MRKRLVSLLLTASLALGLWFPAMGAADTPALTEDAPEMESVESAEAVQSDASEPTEDNAMSLFAAQTPESQSFTVTLDAGEESVEPHTCAVTVTNGQAYGELPEPGRYAHAFLGWFTQQEGGMRITADTIVTLTANQTLYAHWKQVTFLIYLDPNGGAPTYWYMTAYEGEPYGDQIDKTPTRDGYDFLGWFTQREGGELITPDSVVHLDEDQSFYAHWAQSASFPITLDANGGIFLEPEGAEERRSLTVTRETLAADLPVPYWYCYEFLGWFTEKEGGQPVSDDIMASLSPGQTFYAHWTGQTFVITLDPDGGTVSPNTVTVVFDHPYGPLPTPTRDGYAFDGWFDSTLSSTQITPDTVVSHSTLSASETIFAHWTKLPPAPLVIAFESGGGSGFMEALTCRKNDRFTLPDCGFTAPAGMRFYGWKNGEFTYSANFTLMLVDTDMTFTAVWKSTSLLWTPAAGP